MEKTYMPDFINADFAVICQTDGLRRFRIQNGDLVYISVAAEIKDGDVVAVQLFGSKAVYLVEVNFTDEGMTWSVDGGFGLIVTPKDREHGDVRLLGKAVAFTATPGDGESDRQDLRAAAGKRRGAGGERQRSFAGGRRGGSGIRRAGASASHDSGGSAGCDSLVHIVTRAGMTLWRKIASTSLRENRKQGVEGYTD